MLAHSKRHPHQRAVEQQAAVTVQATFRGHALRRQLEDALLGEGDGIDHSSCDEGGGGGGDGHDTGASGNERPLGDDGLSCSSSDEETLRQHRGSNNQHKQPAVRRRTRPVSAAPTRSHAASAAAAAPVTRPRRPRTADITRARMANGRRSSINTAATGSARRRVSPTARAATASANARAWAAKRREAMQHAERLRQERTHGMTPSPRSHNHTSAGAGGAGTHVYVCTQHGWMLVCFFSRTSGC